jgi:hypothetical protein
MAPGRAGAAGSCGADDIPDAIVAAARCAATARGEALIYFASELMLEALIHAV